MPLAQDLLEQAQFLVKRERTRPRQASLRRAVSTAYYACFHLLSGQAAAQLAPGSPAGLCDRVQRSLVHGTMKAAAKSFESGSLPDYIRNLASRPIPRQIPSIAHAFVQLQEERHKADYDVSDRFDRARAQSATAIAVQLFADWEQVRNSDDARVFLASLVFWNMWSK